MARRKRKLEIRFTPASTAELTGIWHWSAEEYGEKRADSYVQFLLEQVRPLSDSPQLGSSVEEFPGLRRIVARRKASGHGHIIVYREKGGNLEVIHIYHTAQDWRNRLEDDEK